MDLLSSGDPQGNVAALAQLLRPYLMQRGELLDFYHGQFREAVGQEYLQTEAQRHAAHAGLAALFNCSERTGRLWRRGSSRVTTIKWGRPALSHATELTSGGLSFSSCGCTPTPSR